MRNIKQKNDENVLQFFNRVVKLFYACRNSNVPGAINDESHQQEIRNIFISGLNNIELRKQLNMNEVGITFENFGRTAQSYSNALKSAEEITSEMKVLNIEASIMRKNYDSDRGYYRSRSRDRNSDYARSDSRDRSREDRLCFRCGQKGHYIKNCRASNRTVSEYRRRVDRSHSRDRNRSHSRDRDQSVRFNENTN